MKKVYSGIVILLLSFAMIMVFNKDNTRIVSTDDHTFIAKGEIPKNYDLKVDKISDSSYDIRLEDKNGNEWQPCDYGKEVEITITDANGYVKHNDEIMQAKRDGGDVTFVTDHFSTYALVSLNYSDNTSKFNLLPCGNNAYYYFDDSTGTLWFHGKPGAYVSGASANRNLSNIVTKSSVKEICFTDNSSKIQLKGEIIQYFADLNNMIYFDASKFDLSQATLINALFNNDENLKEIDLNSWDVSKVEKAFHLFSSCKSLKKVNLDGWTLTNCDDLSYMFSSCLNLQEISGHWTFTSKVTNTKHMFSSCFHLELIDTSGFDLSGCTDTTSMFSSCQEIKTITTANWGDLSKVENASYMFNYCVNLETLDTSRWILNECTNTNNMFNNCYAIKTIITTNWGDLSKVKNARYMFNSCEALEILDTSKWTLNECIKTDQMFENCKSLKTLDASKFTTKTEKVNEMFSNCRSLKELNLKSLNISNCDSLVGLFKGCYSLTSLNVSNLDTSNITNFSECFSGCSSLTQIDISKWDMSKANNLYKFMYGTGITSVIAPNRINTNNIDMESCFFNCRNLTDISDLDSIKIKTDSADSIFYYCISLTEVDTSKWLNYTGNSTSYWFSGCDNLHKITTAGIPGEKFTMAECAERRWAHVNDLKTDKTYLFDSKSENELIEPGTYVLSYNYTYEMWPGETRHNYFGYGDTAVDKIDKTRNGYTFKGWYTDSACTTPYNHGEEVYADKTIYAGWDPISYTVTFDSQGGSSVDSKHVNWSDSVEKPTNPTKKGYVFSHWSKTVGGSEYDFTTQIKEDTTLYAVWTEDYINVTFDVNGGKFSDGSTKASTRILKDHPVTKHNEDPTRDYYSFVGWSTSKTNYTGHDFSTDLSNDTTLYAWWKGNDYTITYENVPNDYTTSKTYTYPNVTIEPTKPTKDGYTFDYWTDKSTNARFTFGSALNKNKTLVAQWEEWKGTVIYNFLLKGKDDTTQNKTITYTGKIENLARGTKEGYTPTGWYYDKACTKAVDFNAQSKIANGGTINVYCNYVENQTKLTWHYNCNNNKTEVKTYSYWSKISSIKPTNEGFTFGGWYTDSACTKAFDFNQPVKATSNLYAKWTENNGTLTFSTNGGSAVANQTVKYWSAPKKPTNPTKEGYTFEGWFTSQTFTDEFDFTQPIKTGKTAYAKWSENSGTLVFNSNGGSAITSQTLKYWSNPTKPANPTKEGYTFGGWYTSQDFTDEFDFTQPIKTDKTVYAKWNENSGVMAFNTNGGNTIANQTIKYWSNPTRPTDPKKEGFTFKGWYTSNDFGTLFDFTQPIKTGKTAYAKWAEDYGTLDFNTNGGTDVTSQTIKYWSSPTEPAAPIKVGFTFKGWYINQKFTTEFDFTKPIKDGATAYAKWSENSGTLTFNTNGGSTIADQTLKYWSKPNKPINPTKEGFTFSGWYTSNDFNTEFDFDTPIETGKTAYAKWTENYGTLVFEENGGSVVVDQTLLYWANTTEPADPTKEGFTFGGWFTDNGTFRNKFTFGQPVKTGNTVYAKWTENTAEVIFNSNGGSAVATKTLKYWDRTEEPTKPVREGFTFNGWFTDNTTFKNQFVFGDFVKTGATLYAKWTEDDATLVFNSNGGSSVATQNLKYWTETIEPENPTKEGFTFGGWFVDNDTFANKFIFGEPIKAGGTVYAKWTENSGMMTFNTDGGNTITSQTLKYWTNPTKPADPTKEGFIFKGWFTSQEFIDEFDFTQPIKTGKTTYAKWSEDDASLVFVSNGGSSVATQNLKYWTNTTEPEDPTKEGFTFGGWYTDDTTFNNKFTFGEPIKLGNTVYAKWVENPSVMEYITNGGSEVPAENLHYWDKPTKPADPTKEGFTFNGWFKTNDFDEEFDFDVEIKTGAKAYAKWEEKSSTMKFDSGEGSPVEEQNVLYWSKPTVPEEPTREGYTFDNWYASEDFDEPFDFDAEMKGRAVTAYAKWLRISTVKFETNGGSEVEDQKVLYGGSVVKPEDPKRYDYNFIGWYKDADLKEVFDFDTEVLNGNDVIIYAKWSKVVHPVAPSEPEPTEESEPTPEPTVEPTVKPSVEPSVKPSITPSPSSSVVPTSKPTKAPIPSETPRKNYESESEDYTEGNNSNDTTNSVVESDTVPTVEPITENAVGPMTEEYKTEVLKDSLILKIKNLFKAKLNVFKNVGWHWWIIIAIILIAVVIRQIKIRATKMKSKHNIDKNNEVNVGKDDK